MKKIIALAFCFLFIFTACSNGTDSDKPVELNEDNYASYVGAGEMTLINILVNSNSALVNDVFIKNHLPVDESKTVTNENGIFAPVVSEKYKTLADLKAHSASIYCEKAVNEIIGNKYVDIDGKLYFNMEYAKSDYSHDWSSPSVTASIESDGRYKIEITVKDEKDKDYLITGYAVNENGSLRLETIYY